MILGTGVDIVEVGRIDGLLARFGERFLRRVFTGGEERYASRSVKKAERRAGRFAVKEAVLKALGTGKSQGILWRDVETLPGPMGRPVVSLHGAAAARMALIGGKALHASITHDGGRAVAFVIIEKGEGEVA